MDMTLVSKIKQAMEIELQDNPDMTTKEYEELFSKYYLYYMDKGYFMETTPKNHSKGYKR